VTESELRQIIREALTIDLEVGDVILTGRFKNKRTVVRELGVDEYGHPTVNGRSILKFKIEKYLPPEQHSARTRGKK
tara:strand:+ start:109 stop:339 length:231 start_codon:yes stop_codon:yes gene_type:complete